MTSLTLLERLRQPDDKNAWNRFVRLYTPLLYWWATSRGLRHDDACDLVQDVLTLLVRKLPEFAYDRNKSFRGWLKTVALNKWRENARRVGGRPVAEQLSEVVGGNDLEAFWDGEYHQHLVRRALEIMQARFEPRTWKACWELVVAGRSGADIAAELEMTEGAVYVAKCRVLKVLRAELAGLLD